MVLHIDFVAYRTTENNKNKNQCINNFLEQKKKTGT